MENFNGFASAKARAKYVCKSEITRSLLERMHVEDCISVDEAKKIFEDIKNDYIVVPTGSKFDKNKSRHTKFVSKVVLYDAIIKGLRSH